MALVTNKTNLPHKLLVPPGRAEILRKKNPGNAPNRGSNRPGNAPHRGQTILGKLHTGVKPKKALAYRSISWLAMLTGGLVAANKLKY